MNEKNNELTCRLGKVGGQAVIEGVMMKSGDDVALSVRNTDGKITTEKSTFVSARKKHKVLDLPIIRGVINFAESMILSFKLLNRSAELLGIEEEESKFDKWLNEKLGKSAATIASVIGTVLGVCLSVFLFMYLPALISDFTDNFCDVQLFKSAVEGVTKIFIFIVYLILVGLIPDMKRVFQYHGAEHKSIFCYEKGLELTGENVKKQSRFHPRCGTSFLFVMMFISIFISVIYIDLPRIPRVCIKLVMLPLIVGIGYEFIKLAGTHDNIFVRALSAPGLWVQRLTTKEPDLDQIEVAVASLKAVLPEFNTAEKPSSEDKNDEDNNQETKNDEDKQK